MGDTKQSVRFPLAAALYFLSLDEAAEAIQTLAASSFLVSCGGRPVRKSRQYEREQTRTAKLMHLIQGRPEMN